MVVVQKKIGITSAAIQLKYKRIGSSVVHVFLYKNTWFQFQAAVSYFSVYFQPKVFLILILIFVFEFPEHSSVKT